MTKEGGFLTAQKPLSSDHEGVGTSSFTKTDCKMRGWRDQRYEWRSGEDMAAHAYDLTSATDCQIRLMYSINVGCYISIYATYHKFEELGTYSD